MTGERKRGRWWMLAAVLVLFAGTAIVFGPYSVREFNGDGTIEDHGYWSSPPRFDIEFSPISLTTPGTYEFHFSGVPTTPLSLGLQIVDSADENVVESLRTHVDLSLTEADGRSVTSFSAPLKGWELSWIPAYRTGKFYDSRLSKHRLKRRSGYSLTITVSDIDPKSPPLEVQPKFGGGGIETP